MRRPLASALIAVCAIGTLLAPAAALAGADTKNKSPYVPLPSVASSIFLANGRHGVLTVEVGLDTADLALRDRILLSQPILRDAYVLVLQPYAYSIAPGAAPNADYIAMALQKETDRVLGRKGAHLLLGSILVN